jgi:hypothetical protein
VKVTARLNGGGFPNADALVNDVRRRAIERLEARIAAREQERRPGRAPRVVDAPTSIYTHPTR